MKKGQLSDKMIKRFPIISKFVKQNKRLPTNEEVRKIFKIAKRGVGETTKDIIDKWQMSQTHCVVCKNPL